MQQAFNWAYQNELIEKPVRFGSEFKKPGKREKRLEKHQKQAADGLMLFYAVDVRECLRAARGWVRACALLGINLSFENAQCGSFRICHVFPETLFYDLSRRKTGIQRQGYGWFSALRPSGSGSRCSGALFSQDFSSKTVREGLVRGIAVRQWNDHLPPLPRAPACILTQMQQFLADDRSIDKRGVLDDTQDRPPMAPRRETAGRLRHAARGLQSTT